LADHAYQASDLPIALDLLAKCEPEPGRPDLRGWEWHYLHRLCHADLLPGMDHTLPDVFVHAVAIRGDGRVIVSAAGLPEGLNNYPRGPHAKIPGELKVWDAATGSCLATLKGHQGSAFTVAFSRDGKWLASGGLDGSVHLWDAGTFETRPGPPAAPG